MAHSIPKPCPLEPNVQEILALANVLFLAPKQHSDAKNGSFWPGATRRSHVAANKTVT
ncbi:hypothetical protein V8B55DRAFT_1483783 [Mucor lusitanicus]